MKHYEMKRKDREVTDREWMEEILKRGQVVHIGLADAEGWPYVVATGYGYKDGAIYLHGAPVGRKNDILAVNPRACFQVEVDVELLRTPAGRGFSMKYRSVLGFGHVRTLTDPAEKDEALKILMDQYDGPHDDLGEKDIARVWVARLEIESMTGKRANYSE